MRDPRHDEFERLRKRAVELGRTGIGTDYRELLELLASGFPVVRKAAASALDRMLGRDAALAGVCKVEILCAIGRETGEQTLGYMLKAAAKCAKELNLIDLDLLRDIARNPKHPEYVRVAASEAIARGEGESRDLKALRRHWCTRCRKTISVEESQRGIDRYGKPYCHHCLEERIHEDANFESKVDVAKRLRTVDEVAVQSRGEKRIGDWLAKNGIDYRYDERMIVAGDTRIRPDFYLPEFDLYIEYWGMNTPEYVANMRKKKVLYQRERKRLISLSYRDFDNLETLLAQKLSRYIRLDADYAPTPSSHVLTGQPAGSTGQRANCVGQGANCADYAPTPSSHVLPGQPAGGTGQGANRVGQGANRVGQGDEGDARH